MSGHDRLEYAGSSHLIGTAISTARDLAGHFAIGRIFPPQNHELAGAQSALRARWISSSTSAAIAGVVG
jgi:hypothetical protein